MNTQQLQELCEDIAIAALNGGLLAGLAFRHDDSGQKALTDVVVVSAGAPVPQLEGPRGYRVEVRIELRTKTPQRNAVLHGEAMRRMNTRDIVKAAAISIGLKDEPGGDDFYILDEEISGDRNDTKNLRKRALIVPFIINPKGA
jgi:hypothetical protein